MGNKRPNNRPKCNREFGNGFNSNSNSRSSVVHRKAKQQLFMSESDYMCRLQEVLYTPEYILTKIFRKDGPPLGVHFESLPSTAFRSRGDPRKSHHEENQHRSKRRKVSMHAILDYEACCENNSPLQRHGNGKGPMTTKGAPIKTHGIGKGLITQKGAPGKKHGIGKGLMTVCRVIQPDAIDFSYDASKIRKKKKRVQQKQSLVRKLANKEQAKKKSSLRSRKVECQKVQKRKQPRKSKCELALEDVKCLENMKQFAMLLDDEELELRELQAGPNPLSCSAHFPSNGSHGCTLCKDLLAKFPPTSVTMKLPLLTQPWASSPELVNKLFKVFHFLCTYAVTISIYSFTLDEFAQAFQDKDSLLLGRVHLTLLKLLLSDAEKELSKGFFSHASKNGRFLGLLHSLEHNGFALKFWQKSLNLLTWTEILRQVFVAAGFGSKLGMKPKEACNKEVNLMEKYGLSPGTLKGQLFSILLTQGNRGMKVSELAKSSSVVELNLTDDFHDLENLITTALSGDITMFEKISLSGYRLRIHAAEKERENCPSDSEDFGSVDDISEVTGGRNNTNDSECESGDSSRSRNDVGKSGTDMLTVYNEIDESHPGEVWLLGLMEGEYSDLSIEEKLNTLAALIDLLSGVSSIRMEDSLTSNAECPPSINHCGSGAKIKRSAAKHCNSLGLLGSFGMQTFKGHGIDTSEQPIDSLVALSKIGEEEKYANLKKITKQMEVEDCLHPMQSIFMGSDRRYNRYWLFLGPCDEFDPGHRRIYFESSEDGHWEMLDSREALCTLMSSLDHRGAREARLLESLKKRETSLCQAMSYVQNDGENRQLSQSDQSESHMSREASSSPVSDVDNRLNLSEMQNDLPTSTCVAIVEAGKKGEKLVEKSGRSQTFDAMIWKSFYSELNAVKNGKKAYLDLLRRCDQCQDLYWRDEKHCRICHTTFELDFDLEERYAVHSAVCRANIDVNKCRRKKVLCSQLQALKAAIYAIESVIPEDALLGCWKRSAHNLWVNRLRRASSLREFLQVLADFVTAINEDWFYQNNVSGSYSDSEEVVSNFSTVPQTFSAVALWLTKLDLLVASHLGNGHSQSKSELINRSEGTCDPK